jgi:CubicO group peptidase (beta-lactamase class C family)
VHTESGSPGEPEQVSLSSKRLKLAYGIWRKAVEEGKVMGCTLRISKDGKPLEPQAFGRKTIEGNSPVQPDTIFLVASVTKPVTATAAMMLVERGSIRLDDPVCSIVPEFGDQSQRDRILVRHLLSHTSGLPDQLPENRELRSNHATLDDFLRKIYKTPILFEPGTGFSYSSSGMAMLMDIVQHVSGLSLAEFARREIFEPLGMEDTSFGVNWDKSERVSQVNIPTSSFQYGEADAVSWNWNSRYWWSLGSPWGGMASTQADLTKFLSMFLKGGSLGARQILSPETVRAMTSDQVATFSSIPEEVRHDHPWGLGWQLKTPFNAMFGDLVSPRTFGHWGATGTLVWADPRTSLSCVILTNQPFEGIAALVSRFSNAVVGSLLTPQ